MSFSENHGLAAHATNMTSSSITTLDRIRSFWDQRAEQFGSDGRATLRETHLREVEVRAMMGKLSHLRPRRVLDVGCGNGWSTRQYAAAFPATQFVGVDFSPQMIHHAKVDCPKNCTFSEANVLDPVSLPPGPFDVIMTQRCLQNLPDWHSQKQAIHHLRHHTAAGGTLLLMECSKDGVEQLNRVRREFGLDPIDGIEPWHNCFLRDRRMIEELGATVECFASTYMFLAKVMHKKLSYVARHLPAIGSFGYDRLYVIR
jgi:ubiquinone/menaquinone biosynthesis C-methylase UbiE